MKHITRTTLSLAIGSLLVSGCLHENSQGPASPAAASSAKVQGVVSKGIIKNGIVSAYPIVNGAIQRLPIATTTTDDKGRYSLSITGYNGPLSILVAPANDGSSVMVCDVRPTCPGGTNFGDDMPFDFSLEALVPEAKPGNAITASVTPLTTMAAELAKTRGLDKEVITQSNEKVAKLLGIPDLLNIEPTDITDENELESTSESSEAVKYGYLSAAITQLAADSGQSIGAILETLSENYVGNNGELVTREDIDSNSVISLEEIITASNSVMEANNAQGYQPLSLDAIASDFERLRQQAENSAPGAPTVTEVTPINSADVETAKALVGQFRTWLSSTANPGAFSQQSKLFAQQIRTAFTASRGAFNESGEAMVWGLSAIGEAAKAVYAGSLQDGDYPLADLIPQPLIDEYSQKTGTAPIIEGHLTVAGTRFTINGATIAGTAVNLDLQAPNSLSGTSFELLFLGNDAKTANKVENGGAIIRITNGKLTLSYDTQQDLATLIGGGQDMTMTKAMTLPASMMLDIGVHLEAKQGAGDPVKFSGTLDLNLASAGNYGLDMDEMEASQGDMGSNQDNMDFQGIMSGSQGNMNFQGGMTGLEILGQMDNSKGLGFLANTLPLDGLADIGNMEETLGGMDTLATNPLAGMRPTLFKLAGEFSNSSDSFSGSLEVTTGANEASMGAGDMGGNQGGMDSQGGMGQPRVKFSFLAALTDLPQAKITIENNTGGEHRTVTVKIEYDRYAITLGNEGAGGFEDTSIIFTNKDTGDRLSVYPDPRAGKPRGIIMIDNKVVGTIAVQNLNISPYGTSNASLLVTYKNGEFESFAF